MKTLGRNADNDLYLEAGRLAIVHDAEAQCAIIESVLQTQQGELQFDEDAGIDYFGTVLQSPQNISFWAAQVRSKIEALDFVADIEDFTYEFDYKTGTLQWSMTVINTDEERLDLRDKKLVIDGEPGIQVDWKDISDKPLDIDDTLAMVEGMRDEAQDLGDVLTSRSTLANVKDVLNKVIYAPTDAEYVKSQTITLKLSGVPLGTVIDFSNLAISLRPSSGKFTPIRVEISDGTVTRLLYSVDAEGHQCPLAEDDNRIWFYDESKTPDADGKYPTTQKHMLMKGGVVTITIRGDITGIKSFNPDLPVLLSSKGTAFPYVSGFSVGSRVPFQSIGDGTFRNLANLQDIKWDEYIGSVQGGGALPVSLGEYAFAGCSSIRGLKWLPTGVQSLGIGCFKGCTSLVSLEGVHLGDGELAAHCFEGCSTLASVSGLPSTINAIGDYAFCGCSSLVNVTGLPEGIVELGEHAFSGCTGIVSILYLPQSLVRIGVDCFNGCSALRSVYIPESIQEISSGVFANCPSLTNIMSDASPGEDVSISPSAFDRSDISLYVPADLLEGYESHSVWGSLDVHKYGVYKFHLREVGANTSLVSDTSRLVSDSIWSITYHDKDDPKRFENIVTGLPSYVYAAAPKDEESIDGSAIVTIKGYVREISAASSTAYPFLSSNSMSESDFPNLIGIEVSDSPLEKIGDYAFAQCTNLATIALGFDENHPYALGTRSFYRCSSLSSTAWLTSGLGFLVEDTVVEYVTDESGNIIYDESGNPQTTTREVLADAFGEGCFDASGVVSLEYAVAGVRGLPADCFANTPLSSLSGIGNGNLTTIGDRCFANCKSLVSMESLGATGITALPQACFSGCISLPELAGMDKIEELGSAVFKGCSGLLSIAALSHTPIAPPSEDTPKGLRAIPDEAFSGCTSLKSLDGLRSKTVDPDTGDITDYGIMTLGQEAFAGCTSLESIRAINDTSITVIPEKCFTGCTGIKTLIGCWNIQRIESEAFTGCTGLLSFSGLGAEILDIESNAFNGCSGLQYVSCLATLPPAVDASAFAGINIAALPLYVREGYETAYASAPVWQSFQSRSSRTIKIHYNNISQISSANAAKTRIVSLVGNGDSEVGGVWFVDYGNGEGFRAFYAEDENGDKLKPIDYFSDDSRDTGNFDITLFGDIVEIAGVGANGFLGSLSQNATSIQINSPYLEVVGQSCFRNYGTLNTTLDVSISMNASGEIGDYAFAKDSNIPESTGALVSIPIFNATKVGAYAFYRSGLSNSEGFATIVEAAESAFEGNASLSSLAGFENLPAISKRMFAGCTSLLTTTGLESVVSIGEGAFAGCSGLTSVRDFGGGLNKLDKGAFSGCSNITRVFIANTEPPEMIPDGATYNTFDGSVFEDAILYVPAGCEDAYRAANGWREFHHIQSRAISFIVDDVYANGRIKIGSVSASGAWVLSFGDNEQSYTFQAGNYSDPLGGPYQFKSAGGSIVVDGVQLASRGKVVKLSGPITSIGGVSSTQPVLSSATAGQNKLVGVIASADMETEQLGEYSFSGCTALKFIRGTDSVLTIGERAFDGATALTDISGLSSVTAIGNYAFNGCSQLPSLYGLSSVSTIGDYAFEGCSSLTKIDGLGTSVTAIGNKAFEGCPLVEVQMFASEPPALSETAFDGLDKTTVPLYVRTAKIGLYEDDAQWSTFSYISSRYIQFTLTECPAGAVVQGGTGNLKSDTYWVVDWDQTDFDGGNKGDGTLPSHTYVRSGTKTIRLEGAVTEIAGKLNPETIAHDPATFEPTGTITGTSFISVEDGSGTPIDILTRVYLSPTNALAIVGNATFLANRQLANAYLRGIKEIGKAAFAYDTRLASLELLESVTEISNWAFYGCTTIRGIPNLGGGGGSITIGNQAFGGLFDSEGKTYIEYIQVGMSDPSKAVITPYSFGWPPHDVAPDPEVDSGWKKAITVYVPLDAVGKYSEDTEWKWFTIDSQVIEFTLENIPSGTTILGLSGTDSIGTSRVESDSTWVVDWNDGTSNSMPKDQTTFPAHTYAYDPNASQDARGLWEARQVGNETVYYRNRVTISISGTIKLIGGQSVSNSPFLAIERGSGNPYLTKIAASNGLKSLEMIGEYAFRGCSNLKVVNGFTHVTSIGQYAFEGCSSLIDIGSNSENWFDSVTNIDAAAFANCTSLKYLTGFPRVLTIGVRAFENCISLVGTDGLGSAYADWAKDSVYKLKNTAGVVIVENLGVGSDVSSLEWWKSSQTEYSIDEITNKEVIKGWNNIILGITTDSSGIVEDLTLRTPYYIAFGAYAFDGCPFGAINMENYTVPPQIQTTTFSVDPSKTLLFTPPGNQAAEERYKIAAVWNLFFKNIISASPIAIEFASGVITGGVAIYGGNGRIDYKGSFVSIDWGDGTLYSASGSDDSSSQVKGFVFPDHVYDPSFSISGSVTIKIRGKVVGFRSIDTEYPFLALSGSVVTRIDPASGETDPDTGELRKPQQTITTYTIKDSGGIENVNQGEPQDYDGPVSGVTIKSVVGEQRIYGARISDVTFGSGSFLQSIGDSCFINCGVAEVYIGSPGEDKINIGNKTFYGCSGLTEVTIEENAVGSIGTEAFAFCPSLSAMTFSEGLQSIGPSAFYHDTALTEIRLPSTLTSVCESAFEGCTGILYGISWRETSDTNIMQQPNIGIGDRAFFGCTGVNNESWSVMIPPQVKSIGAGAFHGCGMNSFSWESKSDSEWSYTLSNNLTAEGYGIFDACSNLGTVDSFPTLSGLPQYAFAFCSNLTSANTILAGISGTVGAYAFAGCTGLTAIEIPSSVTALGDGCFNCSSAEFLLGRYEEILSPSEIPDMSPNTATRGIAGFEYWMADRYRASREDVWAKYDSILYRNDAIGPESLEWEYKGDGATIGAGCFMNCNQLEIDWENNFPAIEVIPPYAFYNCRRVSPNGDMSFLANRITSFGRFALAHTNISSLSRGGKGVISATLSPALFMYTDLASLTGLGELFATVPNALPDACFYGCRSLENITVLDTVYKDKRTWDADTNPRPSIFVPISRLGAYCFAHCTSLVGGNPFIEKDGEREINPDSPYSITSSLSSVTYIGEGCFRGCTGLTTFYGLSLVTYYPYMSFGDCVNLSVVNGLAEDLDAAVSIEGYAFGGCAGVSAVVLPYYKLVATVETANISGSAGTFNSADPFPNIPRLGNENKNATLYVQEILIGAAGEEGTYKNDPIWSQFEYIVKWSGSITPPIENKVVELGISVPPGSSILTLTGHIDIPLDGDIEIAWGDGTTTPLEYGYSGTISHTYVNLDPTNVELTLSIGGDVRALAGERAAYGTGASTTYYEKPLFSSSIDEGNHSYSDNMIVSATILAPSSTGDNPIGTCCFAHCKSLSTLTIAIDGITSFANYSFMDSNLSLIKFEGSGNLTNLTRIGESAFKSSSINSLSFLEYSTNLTTLAESCFDTTRLINLVGLPNSVTSLGSYAFARCYLLTSLEGLDSAMAGQPEPSLSIGCFLGCSSLTSIQHLPSNIKTIPTWCFAWCIGLKSFKESGGTSDLPSGLTTINAYAFYNSGLISLKGLENITALGIQAFAYSNVANLDGLTLSALPSGCFQSTKLTSLYGMPAAVTSIGSSCFASCTSLSDISALASTGVTSLPDYCFSGCSSIGRLHLPMGGSFTTLGIECFRDTGLADLTGLPASVTSLGRGCFKGCTSLLDLSSQDSSERGLANTSITTLPDECFMGCTSLSSIVYIYVPGSGETTPPSYSPLPNTLTNIGANCFAGCLNLKYIGVSRYETSPELYITYIESNSFPTFDSSHTDKILIYVPSAAAASAYTSADPDWQALIDSGHYEITYPPPTTST